MDTDLMIRSAFYVSTAAAAIFLVEAFYGGVVAPISRRRNVNRRLRLQSGQVSGEQALLRLKAERGILDHDVKMMHGLRKLLMQSGLRITLSRFMVLVTLTIFLIAGLLVLSTGLPNWLCLLISGLAGYALPVLVLRNIRSRRQREFCNQLPDALDVVVRSLRSGHPVQTAMSLVGREMPDPIGTEFGITIDEMTYGLDMPKALQNLAARMGVADLSLLVTAVSIQSSSGGNLSEVLDNLSRVLRERFQLRRKVRAISAEGRFSAYGLTILPIVIALAIYFPNPRYYTDVWHEPMFQMVMGGLIVWQLIGDFIMYKMINFKF